MKKIVFFLAIFSVAAILTSCNQGDQTNESDENEQVNRTEEQVEENNNNEEKVEEPIQEEKDEVDQNEQSTDNNAASTNEDKVYENKIFKDVKVSDEDIELVVTGKAQVFEGVFHYALYDGDERILENHYQTNGAPAWGDFGIPIDQTLISQAKNEVRFELFNYSAKDGSKENTLEIPLTTK